MQTITDSEVKQSSSLLIFSGKRVLLLKRSATSGNPNKWGLPGGQRDPLEASYAAAIRESDEELQSVPRHGIIGSIAVQRGARRHELFACKTRKRVRNEWAPVLNHEHVDYRWATLEWCVRKRKSLHPTLAVLLADPEGLRWLERVFAARRPKRLDGGRRASDFDSEAPERLRENRRE